MCVCIIVKLLHCARFCAGPFLASLYLPYQLPAGTGSESLHPVPVPYPVSRCLSTYRTVLYAAAMLYE
jgi:hypothetical protein